ncbi:hypothetical protein [Mycobacterium sp.]|uniref:hypothetical protein n=1 Tax=Mycobacterium sp. TaxID=1785 RepID=UPI001286B1E4|nr:hypothetical protein [Mycobacterium sp.]KAA8970153.1 MAG: hypothetical protein F6Q13_00825 [Mycobacterium sp.]
MSAWFNSAATLRIVVFGVLVGAALPALFALGVRLGTGSPGGDTATRRRPPLMLLGRVMFALILLAAVVAALFIAREFIAHHTGWFILGVRPT